MLIVTCVVSGVAIVSSSGGRGRFIDISRLLRRLSGLSRSSTFSELDREKLSLGCGATSGVFQDGNGADSLCVPLGKDLIFAINATEAASALVLSEESGPTQIVSALFGEVKHKLGTCPEGAVCLCGKDRNGCQVVGIDDRKVKEMTCCSCCLFPSD